MSEDVRYKIRCKNASGQYHYSYGIIQSDYQQMRHWVRFWTKGKEWPSLRLLNLHLEKYLKLVGHIPKEWEIIEVQHQPIPMPEWVRDSFLK